MKNILVVCLSLIVFSNCAKKTETFNISGRATDFKGQPLDSVTIRLKDKSFNNIYETLTDKNGNYSLNVKKGDYYCLYAIKLPEYRVNRLEYWTWNVPVYKDLTINPQYDRLEIYGINVFEPQVTPHETYMIYFRPMSLAKTLQVLSKQKVDSKNFQTINQAEKLLDNSDKVVNISPDSISARELTIEVNGLKAEILSINKITEYAREFLMYGYVVQIKKPENTKDLQTEYDLISITLHSEETGESGKGEAYVKQSTQ